MNILHKQLYYIYDDLVFKSFHRRKDLLINVKKKICLHIPFLLSSFSKSSAVDLLTREEEVFTFLQDCQVYHFNRHE